MPEVLEAVLVALGNVLGFAGLVVLILGVTSPLVRTRLADAAWALFICWVVTLFAFVASKYWLDTYPVHSPPVSLETTSEILENLQSEVVQIWVAALVFKHRRWPGSPESK